MPPKGKFLGIEKLDLDLARAEEAYYDRRLGYQYIYDPPVKELCKGNERIVSIFVVVVWYRKSNKFALFSESAL